MDVTGRRRRRGELIAEVLAGSWRAEPPATTVTSDELAQVAPLLVATGAAGLAWRTARPRPDLLPVAARLREAWLLEVGRERLREELVAGLAAAAEAKGIEVLVYKGWAVARHYPGPGLRPSDDIDVIVTAGDAPAVQAISTDLPRIVLDVHRSPPPGLGTVGALLTRAQRVTVDGATIAIPAPADHLQMAAWHMFKHGGWRPLWLCDIAAMLEAGPVGRPPTDEPYASYWSVATALAASMLEARNDRGVAPEWVRRILAVEWGRPGFRAYGPLAASLRTSAVRAVAELPGRFPNRLAAAVTLGLPIGAEPDRTAPYRLIARRLARRRPPGPRSDGPTDTSEEPGNT
ncbi:MAG: nucleotidyltransferase family protein [Acidimicrobiales bacterium]